MPAAVAQRVEYAGFWIRFAAALIDGVVLWIPTAIVNAIVTASANPAVGWVFYIVVGWLYYALMESSPKQATLGKMALGLVVTDLDGKRISFGRATGRHFAKFISAITLLIGYLMVAWDERKQGLHDKIAGTLVVKTRGKW